MQFNKSLFLIAFISAGYLSACGDTPEANDSSTTQGPTIEVSPAVTETPKAEVKPVVERGASLYKRCRTCHTLNEGGAHKTGPNLYGIFGATAGSKDGFRYSKAMRESGVTWTDENLAAYIQNPSKFMPRNTMSFAGIRKDEDVKLLLEFIRSEMGQ